MAPPHSPHTPSASTSIPTPLQKRSVFGISSSRRPSLSSSTQGANGGNPSLAVAASPQQPTTPAGPGIPSFRALRSLLPFGPSSNKNAPQPSSFASPSTPASGKSHFGFGSVRRSMTKDRERKMSLNEARITQVLAIERSKSDSQVEDTNIRRSVSLSQLDEPLSGRPLDYGSSDSAPVLRTPSPGIPLSQELSTIMEADSSGVSRRVPIFNTDSSPPESRSPSPTILNPAFLRPIPPTKPFGNESSDPDTSFDGDADTSMLNMNPAQLTREVMDAMRAADSPAASALDWSRTDKAVVIDADGPDDTSFALEASILPSVDPDLAALLSPNTLAERRRKHPPSFLPRRRSPPSIVRISPISPRFPASPTTPTSPGATVTPRASPSRESKWYLSPSKSPPSPGSPTALSTSTPAISRRSNQTHLFTPAASSSLSQSTGSKLFNPTKSTGNIGKGRPSTLFRNMLGGGSSPSRTEGDSTVNGDPSSPPMISLSTPPSPSKAPTFARGSLDSRRSPIRSTFLRNDGARRTSLDIQRPSLTETRRPSFDARRGTRSKLPNLFLSRPSGSPEPPSTIITDSSPSPPTLSSHSTDDNPYRASLDSARPSFETSRPTSSARIRAEWKRNAGAERPRTPNDRISPVPHSGASSNAGSATSTTFRSRKRSMSVQERLGRSRLAQAGGTVPANEFGVASGSRPGSSMSVGYSRRSGFEGRNGEATPRPDWLNSRIAAKALQTASLLDRNREGSERDRDSERGDVSDITERVPVYPRERSGSLTHGYSALGPSPLSGGSHQERALGRLGSLRGSASEYNPSNSGRAHSRMAFSEVGGPVSSNRRGSGSYSAYNGGGSNGGSALMESPTFTASSGSRDRDRETPRSTISTAATSISGYGGVRERDRDGRNSRDRDELREMREKHATDMAALLSALSDSQRTVRLLRDENSDVRDRLDRMGGLEAENDELAQICNELRREVSQLRRENDLLRNEMAGMRLDDRLHGDESTPPWDSSTSLRTPLAKQSVSASSSRAGSRQQVRQQEDRSKLTIPSEHNPPPVFAGDEEEEDGHDYREYEGDGREQHNGRSHDIVPPKAPRHVRRLSTASSIFPAPPSNMSMLINEDPSLSLNRSTNTDHFRFPNVANANTTFASTITPGHSPQHRPVSLSSRVHSPPRTGYRGKGHEYRRHSQNVSISSAHNISPTTANFSIMTGSPGSLFLKPEHEMYLGEMESLDLGVRLEDREMGLVTDPDAW
ncbi:hypothetical protein D9611_000509 [Ephemerocybe angulata]|uniref:Uncharacterized protein n=1 Tax=Ephemerocybe angulata TaxID=980116 RepID=A0A8H5BPJ9_9AGAR|nr:hypothetical protein D9611_000509 [Tulosesus angulatus]